MSTTYEINIPACDLGVDSRSAFDHGSLHMGTNTIDGIHQNPGSGWNGDTLQIAFTNAARTCRPAT